MSETPTTWQELEHRCKHRYLCRLGLGKCGMTGDWCEETKCPAFTEEQIPITSLLKGIDP